MDEEWLPPRPAEPTSRGEPDVAERDEPRCAQTEAPPSVWPEEGTSARIADRATSSAEPDEPRSWINRPAASFDPHLPPSRTERSRLPAPPARSLDLDN